MSQRRDGAHHAYRGLSRSPPGNDQISPTNTTQRFPPDNSHRYATSSLRPNHPPVPSPSKGLGVQSILNPPSGDSSSHREAPTTGTAHRDGTPTASTTQGGYGTHHPHRPMSYGPHPGPQAAEQASPSSSHALPALNNPRKILSPRAPRATSIGRGNAGSGYDARQPSFPTAPSFTKRRHEDDASDEARRQHLPSISQSTGTPTVPSASRSISQPLSRPPSIPQSKPQGSPPQRDYVPHAMFPGQQQYPPPTHLHRSFTIAAPHEGAAAWKDNAHRAGSGVATSLMGGEEAFMTLPGTDIQIPVQVDYSQASKKADEKRQRNAKASTRHRRKKKNLQEENIRQLQELRNEHQAMTHEIVALRRQRDFYRDERNRLRELVLRTPSISDQAAGPPTPTSARSVESFADRSPVGPSSQLATPSLGYASEVSSAVESSRQGRRTEEPSDFSAQAYGTPTGGPAASLSSLHGHSYNIPPRPPSAGSVASVERLPPLRTVEGPSASGAHEQNPRTGQWVPVQNRPFETGWATGQRHVGEGPPRQ